MSDLEKVAIDLLRAKQDLDRAKEKADEKVFKLIDFAEEGMSLRELAELTGLSVSYLCDVRLGKQEISIDAFIRIASVKFVRVKLEEMSVRRD